MLSQNFSFLLLHSNIMSVETFHFESLFVLAAAEAIYAGSIRSTVNFVTFCLVFFGPTDPNH